MLEKSQAEPTTVAAGAALPRPWAGRAHLAAAALRRHWLAAVLLAAGLALRVLAQVAYRPVLFYIDTTRYLYNVAPGMDPLGYKGVLRAVAFVGGLGAVAAVQHLLGLAMAVVIYLLLLRRGTPRWLAALATAPVHRSYLAGPRRVRHRAGAASGRHPGHHPEGVLPESAVTIVRRRWTGKGPGRP